MNAAPRSPRDRRCALASLVALSLASCGGSASDWGRDGSSEARLAHGSGGWIQAPAPAPSEACAPDCAAPTTSAPRVRRGEADADPDAGEAVIVLREHGHPKPGGDGAPSLDPAAAGLFRNTYYDFPREGEGARDATLYDATCAPLAAVPREFHDRVCVQGSGRLASGETVSFARRGCGCADICPRTGQRVCFERLDPARFPYGRGATGRPIRPLRTVAVDSSVIPLGTPIYIPEFAGLPSPDGASHDGCFVAEDRGIKVVGRQIDVFTGDPALTAQWNAIVPSNRGVHVALRDGRCRAAQAGQTASARRP